jgi:hypothetical protein
LFIHRCEFTLRLKVKQVSTCMCVHAHVCVICMYTYVYISTSIHIYTILHIVNECEPFSFLYRTKYNIIIKNYSMYLIHKNVFHSLCYNKNIYISIFQNMQSLQPYVPFTKFIIIHRGMVSNAIWTYALEMNLVNV